jgi:hypothetical protein
MPNASQFTFLALIKEGKDTKKATLLQKIEEEKALGGNFVGSKNEYVKEDSVLYRLFCGADPYFLSGNSQIRSEK